MPCERHELLLYFNWIASDKVCTISFDQKYQRMVYAENISHAQKKGETLSKHNFKQSIPLIERINNQGSLPLLTELF